MKVDISIIVPCYNEAGNIDSVFKNIKENISFIDIKKYEIIFVDDGSNDGTTEKLKELNRLDSHVKCIFIKINSGYGNAIRRGLDSAVYNYVFYIDGDGQFDFLEASKMLSLMLSQNLDIIGAYRIKRKDPLYRIFLGWSGNVISKLFFKLTVKDIDCGFKLFKKEVLRKMDLNAHSGLLFGLEIYVKAQKLNLNVKQVPVKHLIRMYGYSKGVNKKQYRLAYKEFFEICKAKKILISP